MKDILAAFEFFTRLPLWRLKLYQLSPNNFKQIINYWAVTGLFTSGVMAIMLWLASQIMPYNTALIIAITSRVLLTGGLHEDGLADFFDGFGGGTSRERILEIMKDSHIGTYGVISLILYFSLFYSIFINFNVDFACIIILTGDPLCKLISTQITNFIPYARNAESSKTKVIYNKISLKSFIISTIVGLTPFVLLLKTTFYPAIIAPFSVFTILIIYMKKKLGGYTGDCCGAMFLLCELSFYTAIGILLK